MAVPWDGQKWSKMSKAAPETYQTPMKKLAKDLGAKSPPQPCCMLSGLLVGEDEGVWKVSISICWTILVLNPPSRMSNHFFHQCYCYRLLHGRIFRKKRNISMTQTSEESSQVVRGHGSIIYPYIYIYDYICIYILNVGNSYLWKSLNVTLEWPQTWNISTFKIHRTHLGQLVLGCLRWLGHPERSQRFLKEVSHEVSFDPPLDIWNCDKLCTSEK